MQRAEVVAGAALSTSWVGTVWSWVQPATDLMQLVVLATTAAASLAAAYYYVKKGRASGHRDSVRDSKGD